MIASLRENAKDVDGSVLDAREARCLAFADAAERGALTWGSFVFRRDVVGSISWKCFTLYQTQEFVCV